MAANLTSFEIVSVGPLSINNSAVEVTCSFKATGIDTTNGTDIAMSYSMSSDRNWKINSGTNPVKETRLSGTFVVKVVLEKDTGQVKGFSLTITATLGSSISRSVDVEKTATPIPQNPPVQ